MARTRTIASARERQLRRRAHRASLRNTAGPRPLPVVDTSERALRVQLGDLRGQRAALITQLARLQESIDRLGRRLERKAS